MTKPFITIFEENGNLLEIPKILKICTGCFALLNVSEYHKAKGRKHGVGSKCKSCVREYTISYSARQSELDLLRYSANPELHRENNRKTYVAHRDKTLESVRKRYFNDREKRLEQTKDWRLANPDKIKVYRNARRMRQNKQKYKITKLERQKMIEIYQNAKDISKETGIEYVVDHVIPLVHNLVCGLHVPQNLQIITSELNRFKSNKFPFDIRSFYGEV